MTVKDGDIVVFEKTCVATFSFGGKKALITKEDDLLAIVGKELQNE